MVDLQPCPFCGDRMNSFAGMRPDAFCKGKKDFAVGCDCSAIGPFRATMEEAIDAWNTRAAAMMPVYGSKPLD